MTKIEAMAKLTSGECDIIVHGKSEYVLDKGDIVNKRSGKPLDTKKMTEEGWEAKSLPKWYDGLGVDEKYILAKTTDGSLVMLIDVNTSHESGEIVFTDSHMVEMSADEIAGPATMDDVKPYIVAEEKVKRKSPTRKKTASKKPEDDECAPEGTMAACPPEDTGVANEDQSAPGEPVAITGETDISDTGEQFDYPEAPLYDSEEELPATQDHPDAHPVPTPEEQLADSCMTAYPEEEPGKQSSPQQNGTSGVETTSQQKDVSDYDQPLILKGNAPVPEEFKSFARTYIATGLNKVDWVLFSEWAQRKGYRLDQLVLKGKDAYFPIVGEFYAEIESKATIVEEAL